MQDGRSKFLHPLLQDHLVLAMTERTCRANGRRSRVRSAVEHVFARQKGPMAPFVRTIGIVRAEAKIGMVNLAYSLKRFVWHQGRGVPA